MIAADEDAVVAPHGLLRVERRPGVGLAVSDHVGTELVPLVEFGTPPSPELSANGGFEFRVGPAGAGKIKGLPGHHPFPAW